MTLELQRISVEVFYSYWHGIEGVKTAMVVLTELVLVWAGLSLHCGLMSLALGSIPSHNLTPSPTRRSG